MSRFDRASSIGTGDRVNFPKTLQIDGYPDSSFADWRVKFFAMNFLWRFFLWAAPIGFIGSFASAQMVDWDVRGVIDSTSSVGIPSAWASEVTTGEVFDMHFRVDDCATPFLEKFPGIADFAIYHTISGSADVGSRHFDFSQAGDLTLIKGDAGWSSLYLGGVFSPNFSFLLSLSSAQSGLTGLDIPKTPPLLTDFDLSRDITISEFTDDSFWTASAQVDTMEFNAAGTPVPEPASFAYVSLGLIACAATLRRIRNKRRAVR